MASKLQWLDKWKQNVMMGEGGSCVTSERNDHEAEQAGIDLEEEHSDINTTVALNEPTCPDLEVAVFLCEVCGEDSDLV